MVTVDFDTLLIGVEGAKTPAGDPAGAKSAEEAPRNAREPLAPGAEINRQV